MDEMKDLQRDPEQVLPEAVQNEIPPEEISQTPTLEAAPEELFEPTPTPGLVTDDVLSFIHEQLNDNWLEEFLRSKQEEEQAAVAEEPMIEEPVIEAIVIEDSVVEEPVAEAPTAEEPAVEEPVVEEPVAEESVAEEPVIEEPVIDEPAAEALIPEEEKEIGIDMLAAAAAGLVRPEDRELEKILAENWDEPEPEAAPAASQEAFPVEEEMPVSVTDTPEEADEIPSDEEIQEEPDMENTGKKRRPRMKKGYGLLGIPHVLVTVIWLALIVVIAVPIGRLLWLAVADVMAFGKPSQSITLTISEEDTVEQVAQKLGDAEIVRYPWLFTQFAELTGKGERIDPGTYTLNSHLDYNALLNNMVNYGPVREVVTVMFPEGYNCAQIFAKLEENGVCSVADLEAYAADGELAEYWFLEGVERGSKYCLEGYLTPDTYEFYTHDDPGRVLEKFLDAFDARFTDKMKEDFATMQLRYNTALANNGYGQSYIDEHPLTLHKVMTLASIVQKETANDTESYAIASVFYNRLTNPGNHPYLGSDATVYYAIGDYFGEVGELTAEHLAFDSPYNTRNHPGLPPGPICNPGAYSLYAALDPDDTNYYYFVYSVEAQKHLFSSTLAEHEQKLKELGL